jgi:hypothetical protein
MLILTGEACLSAQVSCGPVFVQQGWQPPDDRRAV